MPTQQSIQLMSARAAEIWKLDVPPLPREDIQIIWTELRTAFALTEDEECDARAVLNAMGLRELTDSCGPIWRGLKEVLSMPPGVARHLALVGMRELSGPERRPELIDLCNEYVSLKD